MSNKIDKNMLKNPDVFISTSDMIFNFIEHHFKTVLAVVLAGVLISVGYISMNWMGSRKESKAADALYSPEAALKKAESDERTKLGKDKSKKEAEPSAEAPVDYAKTYAPLVEKLKAAIVAHGDTKAALVSALNLSNFLAQQNQYKEALEVLSLPKARPPEGELLSGFWNMHRGVIFLENGQVDPALQSYSQVVASPSLKAFHPEALIKLGICYEMKGDASKARESYEKVGREFPESEASNTAQQYIRLLELNARKQG